MNPSSNSINSLPRGFIPVMITPFLESGQVDYDCLSQLTEFYLEAGAAGLFANCLSSEMYELTEEERLAVTRRVVETAAGRVPVVATGTFGGPLAEQADFIKRIHDTGVQAVIVITSLLAKPDESDEVFMERMHQLLDLTDGVPLGFYECPVPYKRLIDSKMLAYLLPTGRIVYHKDTCLDAEEVARRLKVAEGYQFGLYDAYMVNAVSSLKAGAAGLSCIQGNHFPELVVWLCDNYGNTERQEEVAKVQQFFDDCMDLAHTAYPTLAKYSLQKRGLPMSLYTRRQVEPLTPAVTDAMDDLLAAAARLSDELAVVPVSRLAV
ncbi:dihydrodipicolinate synthase family protein [Persicitalea jodogahamensis]|uniref:Dihydrodipicolinate synthase family protein n=1 Tax=Persicitalea jodogahamensis TaxID=402147 RepID=A0A8J3D8F1_9BACT|nr:dihydrodipicolinate synthase family protein [Persicitalea jodogahamensis]GHB68295.1 dihydrodipicolinate synthase family protein [Persicitalea jodogahamensis]